MGKAEGFFILIGSFFLCGLLTQIIANRINIPRVSLLLLLGFVFGPSVLNLLSAPLTTQWFPFVTKIALGMVGFLIGGKLTLSQMRRYGRKIITISVLIAITTLVLMIAGILLLGQTFAVSLFLSVIALATEPAATTDVINEMKSKSSLSQIMLGIVAIDDFWGIILFSMALVVVNVSHQGGAIIQALIHGGYDILGAMVLGMVLGIPFAFMTGRVAPGEPTLVEALGAVFLCVGLAIYIKVSFMIAVIVMGVVIANVAHHHKRPFHAIEGIEWPFMIVFFILAGASFHIQTLLSVGIIGGAYIVLRILARLLGTWCAAPIFKMDYQSATWLGLGLLPQAGVALGMALLVVETYPELNSILIPIALSSTVFFEVIGPILTRQALLRSPG